MTQPYTDTDVDLVARELRTTVEGGETVTDAAGRILSALAAAGRLTPAGAEWKWGIRLKSDLGGTWILPRDDEAHARQFLDEQLADRESCELVRHWVGPWLPVPAVPAPLADRLGDTWASPVTVTGFDTEEER